MEKPTREEMIRMAQETRKNVTSAPVSEEEMQQYPVSMELMQIPTRVGNAKVYLSGPLSPCSDILLINFHG
ncbi:MAG: hypothetical protein IIZ39_01760, partial [Blautia sp.]|nr:hypothetical protein [Blautia sp.]